MQCQRLHVGAIRGQALSKSSVAVPWFRAIGCRFGWLPAPGEAIDSWLEETARYMALPLRAVARALDLPVATRPTWIRWLSRDQLDVIQAATGVSTSVVEALTLSVYDGIALQLDPNSHRLDAREGPSVVAPSPAASARRIRVPWTTRRNVGHSDLAVAKLLQRLENHLWATVEAGAPVVAHRSWRNNLMSLGNEPFAIIEANFDVLTVDGGVGLEVDRPHHVVGDGRAVSGAERRPARFDHVQRVAVPKRQAFC